MKKKTENKKKSLQNRLIKLFLLAIVIPIFTLVIFSYFNILKILNDKTSELAVNNLMQTDNNLQISLVSYEDMLYQIYTNDDIVTMVGKLNNNEDVALTKSQLRRYFNNLLNSKDYIRSITVITKNGKIIAYDKPTSVTNKSMWIDNYSKMPMDIYKNISQENKTYLFATEYGNTFADVDYYLFHIGHRIIDYKNPDNEIGVVLISIDEELLESICITNNKSNTYKNFNFIVSDEGKIFSYPKKEFINLKITDFDKSYDLRKKDYINFINNQGLIDEKFISVSVYHDEELNLDIVNVANIKDDVANINKQSIMIIAVGIIVTFIAFILTYTVAKQLSMSVQKIVRAMQNTNWGNTNPRVLVDKTMPKEIEMIAIQYNETIDNLERARKNEKEASDKFRRAEIKALEAQINPHFLYNTLDTINWLAIDEDQYEISNAITSLASILRYGINNSTEKVTIREEINWLKKYLFLQQTRLKSTLNCEIDIEQDLLDDKIYKLLLQPFLENSIIHGFQELEREYILTLKITADKDNLNIVVLDNGKGIEKSIVDKLNNNATLSDDNTQNHIGVVNVISRVSMYYGDSAKVFFESEEGVGTKVSLIIPREGEKCENSHSGR